MPKRSFFTELFAAYGGLGPSFARQVARGHDESRLLFLVSFASLVRFIAEIPKVVHTAAMRHDGDAELDVAAVLGAHFLSTLVIGVIFLYLMAGITHFIGRRVGGQGSYERARLALFWALCVVSPIVLIGGVIDALTIGQNLMFARIFEAIEGLALLWVWANFFAQSEQFKSPFRVFAIVTALVLAIAGGLYGVLQ